MCSIMFTLLREKTGSFLSFEVIDDLPLSEIEEQIKIEYPDWIILSVEVCTI